jgi:hypothetical protein
MIKSDLVNKKTAEYFAVYYQDGKLKRWSTIALYRGMMQLKINVNAT